MFDRATLAAGDDSAPRFERPAAPAYMGEWRGHVLYCPELDVLACHDVASDTEAWRARVPGVSKYRLLVVADTAFAGRFMVDLVTQRVTELPEELNRSALVLHEDCVFFQTPYLVVCLPTEAFGSEP